MSTSERGRREDLRLLSGGGAYTADIDVPGQAYAAFVRSTVAHGTITAIDTTAAEAMPGVVCIITGADLARRGFGKAPHPPGLKNFDGTALVVPDWPPLANDRVRFVGEAVAIVVAVTASEAADAAEAVAVEIDPLDAATGTVSPSSPAGAIWPHAPENVAFDYRMGDAEACAAAFAGATTVVRISITNQRVVVNPMEPRAAIGIYDPVATSYLLYAGCQGAAALRDQLATMMGLAKDRVRVVSRDVGGGFGAKLHMYPEYIAVLTAAEKAGRPVKWVATRSEAFLSDTPGRDTTLEGELALDGVGRFLALRVKSDINIGAYQSSHAVVTATANLWRCLASVYLTPAISVEARCRYSNTVPVAPYRGAGRPEAALILERLVEIAAAKTGIDRVALRRRNMIEPASLPYAAPTGVEYDSGDFTRLLDRAADLADYRGFSGRREQSLARGRLRGIGVASYLEITSAIASEDVRLELAKDGRIYISGGFHSNGQGHATVFPALVARELDVPAESCTLGESDSALVPNGVGSFGSRSMAAGGAACIKAADALKSRLLDEAARLLQARSEDLVWQNGAVAVGGSARTMTLAQIAAEAAPIHVLARGEAPMTFPNGCHVAEVEIDPATGETHVVAYTAVDDVGTCFNEQLVEGQVRGGIAQGLGQVLFEHAVYDEGGQMLNGSFMDYAMPRAHAMPRYRIEAVEIPTATNPLGAKGAGEAGTTGSLAAGYNAVMDALAAAGIRKFDMPASPGRIWHALQAAGLQQQSWKQ
jgi:carbon-monoxide dehydrogenase large subunit